MNQECCCGDPVLMDPDEPWCASCGLPVRQREYEILSGREADAGLLEDRGTEVVLFKSGPHAGHKATVETAKFNCGAYRVDVSCQCGKEWQNRMDGCWQWGHQRREHGDSDLGTMF